MNRADRPRSALLTNDPHLAAVFLQSAGRRTVTLVHCLSQLGSTERLGSLYVDPRALHHHCVMSLLALTQTDRLPAIYCLMFPLRPDPPPGTPHALVARLSGLAALSSQPIFSVLRGQPVLGPAASAWRRRAILLSPDRYSSRVRRFISLAIEQGKDGLTVCMAAAQLNLSMRQLFRLSSQILGFTPSIVLGCARVASVVRDLAETEKSFACIAQEHRYSSRHALTRQVVRFTGMPPRGHRKILPSVRSRAKMSEIGVDGETRPSGMVRHVT